MFHTSAEMEIVRQMKEKCCYVAFNPADEEATAAPVVYTLPDGSTIEISTEAFRAPEVLFQPHIVGYEYRGKINYDVYHVQGDHFI